MRCHLFWTPLFYLYDSKKCGQICLYQDIRAWTPITSNIRRMPTQIRANIRYIQESDYNGPRLNVSSIKQMLIYVCCLSVVLCHRRVVVRFYVCFNRPNVVDTFSDFSVSERGRDFIQLCLSATPFEGRRRHIGDFGNKVWYYPPTGVGMYLN